MPASNTGRRSSAERLPPNVPSLPQAHAPSAIFGNFYYTQHIVIDESSLGRFGRTAIVIAVIIAGLAVTLFTNKGHALLTFAREAYVELRKVVWPTRQEAVQTTIIVFVGVCVVSLFLYLCDLVFLQVVKAITL